MTGAVLYLRVSTDEQVANLSLDVQEQACREVCAREGWPVVAVFREEGASAKTLERRELQRLLAYVGRHAARVGHVVVYRVDRLSRDREGYFVLRHALRRHGVQLASAREEIRENTIESVIVETFSILQAQVDNIIRSSRAKAGAIEAMRRGRWVWEAPVGYRLAPRDAEGRATGIELDPDAAPAIRRGFELVAGGATIRDAHRHVVAAGVRLSGRPIRYEAFRRMLHRPIYAGRIVCQSLGVDAPSRAPAIVDDATWSRVQRALDRRASRYIRRPEGSPAFPLRGVVRCPCGRRLVAYRARGKTGRRWPYYRCQRCGTNTAAWRVEAAWKRLLERLAAPEQVVALLDRMISRLVEQRAADLEERLARARRRLSASEARLERLLSLRIDGELTPEEYTAHRGRLVRERDQARGELAEISTPSSSPASSPWSRLLLTDPERAWRELSEERRVILAERLFPEGVTLLATGELSNPTKSLLLLPLRPPAEEACSGSGPQEAICEPTAELAGRILSWRRDLAAVEAAVLGRAA